MFLFKIVEDKNILKIVMILSIAGILVILFLSERIQPSCLDINNISYSLIDHDVRIKGQIFSLRDLPSIFLMDLKDDSGTITVIAFKEENTTLKENDIV